MQTGAVCFVQRHLEIFAPNWHHAALDAVGNGPDNRASIGRDLRIVFEPQNKVAILVSYADIAERRTLGQDADV